MMLGMVITELKVVGTESFLVLGPGLKAVVNPLTP